MMMEILPVKGMAHITGGGLPGNIPRMLPEGAAAELETNSWSQPPLFTWLQQTGGLSAEEMMPVFNMGIGFVICVSEEHAEDAMPLLAEQGEAPCRIGRIVPGSRTVSLN